MGLLTTLVGLISETQLKVEQVEELFFSHDSSFSRNFGFEFLLTTRGVEESINYKTEASLVYKVFLRILKCLNTID